MTHDHTISEGWIIASKCLLEEGGFQRATPGALQVVLRRKARCKPEEKYSGKPPKIERVSQKGVSKRGKSAQAIK